VAAARDHLEARVRHRGDDALGEGDRNGRIGLAVNDESRTANTAQEAHRTPPVHLRLLGRDDVRRRLEADCDHLLDHIG
jgi:hypothetical protein